MIHEDGTKDYVETVTPEDDVVLEQEMNEVEQSDAADEGQQTFF